MHDTITISYLSRTLTSNAETFYGRSFNQAGKDYAKHIYKVKLNKQEQGSCQILTRSLWSTAFGKRAYVVDFV